MTKKGLRSCLLLLLGSTLFWLGMAWLCIKGGALG